MQIGEKIINIIREKGMTQKEFSKRTGIPQSTISEWKSKKGNPSSDKIIVICNVLEVTPYDLLLEESDDRSVCDAIFVSKASEVYSLIEIYQKLPKDMKKRILGYADALYKQG